MVDEGAQGRARDLWTGQPGKQRGPAAPERPSQGPDQRDPLLTWELDWALKTGPGLSLGDLKWQR